MDYHNRRDLEPLRVRAWLRSGVVGDRYLPLDGILFYQSNRDRLGPQIATLPGYTFCQDTGVLPIDIVHPGQERWYYRCSWAQWSHDVEGRDYWNKRFDITYASLIDFHGRRGKVIVEKGRYKTYRMPVFYRAALWVEWYCVGNRTEIEYLLSTVTHIGKKGVQGWGRVIRWEIEPLSEDWSVWRDGKLMRGIPIEDVSHQAFKLEYYGIRPPYWNKANQMPLAIP